MFTEFNENQIITIDIHNHTVSDAKQKLHLAVKIAPTEIKEIVVIHGYHSGTALRDMVRNDFESKRVARKYLSLNPGITSLILHY
jgi:hypothetical protein